MDIIFIDNGTTAGELSLLVTRPRIAIPYIAIIGLIAVVGTVGNLLIIGTWTCGVRAMKVGNYFTVNLALSDMIVTALINPFAIAGVSEGGAFFHGREYLCRSLASICIISCGCSLLSIGCISIDRYIYICHNTHYAKIYTKRSVIFMCLCVWVAGVFLDLPNHVGWSRHAFDNKNRKCLWDRNYQYGYTVFFAMFAVFISLVVILAFYIKIFQYIGAAQRRLVQVNQESMQNTLVKTIRQTRMMFIIFIAFIFCWTPFILIMLIDRDDTLPPEVHLFTSLVAHTHASVNFIIYGLSTETIRVAYLQFLKKRVLCCLPENPCQVPTPNSVPMEALGQRERTSDLTGKPTCFRLCCCTFRKIKPVAAATSNT